MMVSKYQLFVDKWKGGCGARICQEANRICLARGQVPCDVLFCGEAPGESEDVIGSPFVGPAGQLLDHVICQALPDTVRYAITNLVGCIPRDDEGQKTIEPDDESVEACKPRLVEFIELCNPKLIVCVGNLARNWLDPGFKHSHKLHKKIPQIHVYHPAYILRCNIAQRGLLIQRVIIQMRSAYEEYVNAKI